MARSIHVLCSVLLLLPCANSLKAATDADYEGHAPEQPYLPFEQISHPPLSGPLATNAPSAQSPANELTPEQIEFWQFLEQYNRPPDDATELQRKIFATRGEAPAFTYLHTATNSVFGNLEGVTGHRATFIARYP